MCSCHSIPECCVMFSGVKLSTGSFVLFQYDLTLKGLRRGGGGHFDPLRFFLDNSKTSRDFSTKF